MNCITKYETCADFRLFCSFILFIIFFAALQKWFILTWTVCLRFVLNVPPTSMIIWRRGHPTDWTAYIFVIKITSSWFAVKLMNCFCLFDLILCVPVNNSWTVNLIINFLFSEKQSFHISYFAYHSPGGAHSKSLAPCCLSAVLLNIESCNIISTYFRVLSFSRIQSPRKENAASMYATKDADQPLSLMGAVFLGFFLFLFFFGGGGCSFYFIFFLGGGRVAGFFAH